MKEALAPLGMIPLAWNSSIKRRTSDFIVIQKSLINLKLRPSGPGLLPPLQSQTAFLTSSSLNLSTNIWLSWSPIVWKEVPFKTGLLLIVSWNLCWKKLQTSMGVNHQVKISRYLTPSLIQRDLAFCLIKDSWAWAADQRSCCSFFLFIFSWEVSCLCSASNLSLLSSASNF